MHELSRFEGSGQRCRQAAVHGYGLLTQLHGIQRILHALIDGDIARDDRDGLDLHIGILHRQHQCDGIIRGGVRINKEMTRHIPLLQMNENIVA